jgi:hypothetical protein
VRTIAAETVRSERIVESSTLADAPETQKP